MNNTRRLLIVVTGLLLAPTRPTAAATPTTRRLDGVGVCGDEPDPSNPPPCMDQASWKDCTNIRDYSGCDNMLVTHDESSCPRSFACLEWDTCSKQVTEEAQIACQSVVDGGCYAVVITRGLDGTKTFGCGDPEEPTVMEDVQPAPGQADDLDPTPGGPGYGNGGNGVRPSMTEDQCKNSGGVAFYDPGNGSTKKAGYLCDDTDQPPMADISGTNGWKGAVCCPVKGQVEEDADEDPASPVENDNGGLEEDDPAQVNEADEEPVDPQEQQPVDPPADDTEQVELAPLSIMTEDECKNSGGVAFYDPGDGRTMGMGYVCDDTKLRPLGSVSGTGADEGAVCCPVPGATNLCTDGDCDDNEGGVIERVGERPQLTKDECASSGGEPITDPGDASTRREDYVCTNGSGLPPVGNIRYEAGEPMAREGEVCCPLPTTDVGVNVLPSMADDDECGAAGGWVYVDDTIDTTTVDRSNFLCPPPIGEPPIGTVQSREGAVCCPLEVSGGGRKSIPLDECMGTGGEAVVLTDGNVCPSTGQNPVADIEGSTTGEVCCLMEGEDEGSLPAERPNVGSREDCASMGGTYYVDPGDGRSGRRDFICPGSGLPPLGDIQSGAMEGEVCCPASDEEIAEDRPSINTREDCTKMGGDYYVDPGDGSTLLQSFLCPNGEPPLGDIQQTGGMEGEVCCPIIGEAVDDPLLPDAAAEERPLLTRGECEATAGGGMYHVVGDPGDGSTRMAGYVCPDTAEGPIANIRYEADEPIATEGEVCCPLPITTGVDQQTMMTLVECDEANGRAVAPGDGSETSDFLFSCPDGETSLGVIRYEVGEQITTPGEICCVSDDRDGASGALSDSPAAVARGGLSPLALILAALFIVVPHIA